MSLTARETGGAEFDAIAPGTYSAICYAVVDLGTHHQEIWKKDVHKILLSWEIPEERIEFTREGKAINIPRTISKRYTLSLHAKASLRRDLEAWRGKRFTDEELTGFDVGKIAGAHCLLGVVLEQGKRDGRVFAAISSVMAQPRTSQQKPGTAKKPEHDIVVFAIPEEPEAGFEIPDTLPDWIAATIHESKEWRGEMPSQQEPEETPPGPDADETGEIQDDENLPF